MYTGVPVIGISPSGAKHLRQKRQENPPKTPTPIDLEGTHLSERLGKYMVTTPLSCIAMVKTHVEILLSKDPSLYLDKDLPTGPMLQESRRAPNQSPEDEDDSCNFSHDPYGDMSVASAGSSVKTTISYKARQQQATAALPPLKPNRPNAWQMTLLEELLSNVDKPVTATQNKEALQEQTPISANSSVTDISQISVLTEENSQLRQALNEKSKELQTVQGTHTNQIADLQATRQSDIQQAIIRANEFHAKETLQLKGTIIELQNTLQKSNELVEDVKQELYQSQTQLQCTMDRLETINDSHLLQKQQAIKHIQTATQTQLQAEMKSFWQQMTRLAMSNSTQNDENPDETSTPVRTTTKASETHHTTDQSRGS